MTENFLEALCANGHCGAPIVECSMNPFLKLFHHGGPSFHKHVVRLVLGREQFGKDYLKLTFALIINISFMLTSCLLIIMELTLSGD